MNTSPSAALPQNQPRAGSSKSPSLSGHLLIVPKGCFADVGYHTDGLCAVWYTSRHGAVRFAQSSPAEVQPLR
jgi:hypothetical protein